MMRVRHLNQKIAMAGVMWLIAGSGCLMNAAVTLVEDTFNGLASGATLTGRAPTTNVLNGNVWVGRAETDAIRSNGAGGMLVNTGYNQTATLDLGANYFTANPGIYQLSLTVTHPTNYGDSWVGFGFATGINSSANLTGNGGGPWMFNRASGAIQMRADAAGTVSNVQLSRTAGSPYTYMIELNTTGAQWSYQLYIDGVVQDLNGAAAGTAYTYAAGTNPTGLRYLALGSGISGTSGSSTIDNFSFVQVPEPSMAALGLMAGMLGLMWRRRDGVFH